MKTKVKSRQSFRKRFSVHSDATGKVEAVMEIATGTDRGFRHPVKISCSSQSVDWIRDALQAAIHILDVEDAASRD